MKFKAGTITAKIMGLSKVLQMDGLENRLNYLFSRMANPIQGEYEAFENARKTLIMKHAELDEDGEPKSTSKDADGQYMMADREAFDTEFNELRNEDLEVNIQPVRMSLILESKVSVNGATINQLGELIVDDIEEGEQETPLKIIEKEQ